MIPDERKNAAALIAWFQWVESGGYTPTDLEWREQTAELWRLAERQFVECDFLTTLVVPHACRIAYADGIGGVFTALWPVLIEAQDRGGGVNQALIDQIEIAQRTVEQGNPFSDVPLTERQFVALNDSERI